MHFFKHLINKNIAFQGYLTTSFNFTTIHNIFGETSF